MDNSVKEILELIESQGYQAYIIGGYPRDFYIGHESNDYDICTNMPVDELKKLFPNFISENYGSLKVLFENEMFEITVYRKEISYRDVRTPIVEYTDSLEKDLKRRDFVMNTLCMDKDKNFIDLMGAIDDIKKHIIRSIGDADKKLSEDPLRILRAIRFATTLGYEIDEELDSAIRKHKSLVKNLSYYRKKEELERIFVSHNVKRGIELLKDYDLEDELDINLSNVNVVSNTLGIWAQVLTNDEYPFTNKEKDTINDVKSLLRPITIEDIYYYSLEECIVSREILGEDTSNVYDMYLSLPIHDRKDIKVSSRQLLEYTKEPDKDFILIEKAILNKQISNDYDSIINYVKMTKQC